MAEFSVNNGNIHLIDPNQTISSLPDGTPDYESMFIFASLSTKRRVRSVLETEGDYTKLLRNEVRDTNISMMGFDNETGEYTTAWTENEDNPNTLYEGFGITSINIKTNSSYIPQVTIEFVDIRGLAFFNRGSKSPYQALFDFPPPLFELTVKGYYGKSLTYQLHLVKHSTKFQADTGNFTITAEFIARTFAPLTDVPFKYIDILPLLIQETSQSLDPEVLKSILGTDEEYDTSRQAPTWKLPAKNTHELILKLENLYDTLAEIKQSSDESRALDDAQQRVTDIQNNIRLLDTFRNTFSEENQRNSTKIFTMPTKALENDDYTFYTELKRSVSQFNKKIQATKTDGVAASSLPANSDDVDNRLYLAVRIDENDINASEVKRDLNVNYRKKLIDEAKIDINKASKGLVRQDQLIAYREEGENVLAELYVALDITGYYKELKDTLNKAENDLSELRFQLTNKINNKVQEELGYKPTIYNIFKTICDDVDIFYNILRSTSYQAEEHHNTYQSTILNSDNIPEGLAGISAFPLYIELTAEGEGCNVERRERKYPSSLSNKLPEPFPETILVDDFVNAFIRLEKERLVRDLKTQEDEEGNNKWIPSTPLDSEISFGEFGRRQSPYLNLEFQYPGIDNIELKYLNKVIERFYIISQYSFARTFYEENNDFLVSGDFVNQDLIEAYAKGEASNLANSLTNSNTIELLKKLADDLSSNTSQIQERLQQAPAYSNTYLLNEEPTSKFISLGDLNRNPLRLYKDRNESNYDENNQTYQGFFIQRGGSDLRGEVSEGSTNPIDKYISGDSDDTNVFRSVINYLTNSNDNTLEFTKENIIYNNDVKTDNFTTKFINSIEVQRVPLATITIGDTLSVLDNVLTKLPSDFEFADELRVTNVESSLPRIIGEILGTNNNGRKLLDLISGGTPTIDGNDAEFKAAKAFILGSNFLKARSFFHSLSKGVSSTQINDRFIFPSIVEVPYFTLIYMGGIVRYNKEGNENFRAEVDALIDQFILPGEDENGNDKGFENGNHDYANFQLDRFYIRNLIFDVANDEEDIFDDDQSKFEVIFNNFVSQTSQDEFSSFESAYRLMIINSIEGVASTELINELADRYGKTVEEVREEIINNIFDQDFLARNFGLGNNFNRNFIQAVEDELTNGDSKSNITDKLFEPYSVVVPNELSFFIPNISEGDNVNFTDEETDNFIPLEETYDDQIKARRNRLYFVEFFKELSSALEEQKTETENIENQADESTDDGDIKSSLYYSFKSISDKWIAGIGGDIFKGFPNNNGDRPSLIDHFMFVDRAMNPIGQDCVIDIEPLLDLVKDYDVNVFSVMSTLLSHNGFEFFPLQNFMSFENDWEDSFRIIETIDKESAPNFVCMYIGGTATQLDNETSQYPNDGILDLNEPDLVDFVNDCGEDANTPETNAPKKPYSQVRAFRVRFAEQNQSFFQDIQLDGKEFTETSDSLAILSKIAGDNSNSSPVPKGQNLFNIYENRAYSAKVKMLSNMMIQPTQYFQLENIPLYSGAYIILDVEHSFIANHATTQFQGTKILKFPNPLVKEYAVIVGFQSGSAEDISGFQSIDDLRENNPSLYDDANKSGFIKAIGTPLSYPSQVSGNQEILSNDIHPLVKNEFAELFRAWEEEGYFIQINSGFRNKQTQATTDSGNRVVAKPGLSFHQYGLAIDVTLRQIDANGNPTERVYFQLENPYWDFDDRSEVVDRVGKYPINSTKSIAQIAEERGFRWGGRFRDREDRDPDLVHFEKTLGYGYGDGSTVRRREDISAKPIYNNEFPRYDLLPEKEDDKLYGTNYDLARRVREGKVLGKFVILDPKSQEYIDRRF